MVGKVNFNGGDELFFRTRYAVRYIGRHDAFAEWLEEYATRHRFQAFVMFGQSRPVHQIARAVASRLNIAVHVFEEGYVRPDYITLEEGGVNALSRVPRDINYYNRLPDGVSPVRPMATGQKFRKVAAYATAYALAKWAAQPIYKHHVYHREISPWVHTWRWGVVGSWRKIWNSIKERNILQALTAADRTKRFFLLVLQVHNDSQMVHHSRFDTVEEVIERTMTSFAKNAQQGDWLIIKHHPVDRPFREYGKYIDVLAKQLSITGRVRSIHDLHLPTLLDHAKGVINVNSTTGLQALLHSAPVAVLGDCMYDIPGIINARDADLNHFWKQPGSVNKQLFLKFRSYLIKETQLNASFYGNQYFMNTQGNIDVSDALRPSNSELFNRRVKL